MEAATHAETAPGADDETLQAVARDIESANPLWIVMFGVFSKQFVAFPRFTAPRGTVVSARYPAAMRERMRHIEHAARTGRDRAAQAAPADHRQG
jgi:hypothetical protein